MVMQKVRPAIKNGGNRGRCSHHWVIESARAETSWGVCKLCGETKEFMNWVPPAVITGYDVSKAVEGGRRGSPTRNPVYNPIAVAYELAEIRG